MGRNVKLFLTVIDLETFHFRDREIQQKWDTEERF